MKIVEERFWSKVEMIPFHECWEWNGAKQRQGYGQIRLNRGGGPAAAHRVSWYIHFGEIPKGLYVCHKCDNPGCVNPKHLFLGTFKDNMNDMFNKGRNSLPPIYNGEENSQNILTKNQVILIRKEYTGKYGNCTFLSRKYGVDRSCIYRIVKRINWKHI